MRCISFCLAFSLFAVPSFSAGEAQDKKNDRAAQARAAKKLVTERRGGNARIVNGENARPGELPWQAAIIARDDGSGTKPIERLNCGGTFIRPNIVMTAAHCVQSYFIGNLKSWQVVSGGVNLNDPAMVAYDITDVIVHPRYEMIAIGSDYDFAILRVAQSYTGPTIDIVSPSESARLTVGSVVQVSGWGDTSEGGSASERLQKVNVKIVGRNDCNDSNSYDGLITSRMVCASLDDKDSCQGDSGGPLTARFGNDRRLVGVVSFGSGCARTDKPGVYGRLIAVRGWINDAIDMLERVE
jgi:secreted trypsin-like serine protease